MERAMDAVRRGDMGLNEASRSYAVPKATLKRHLDGKNKIAREEKQFHGGVSCLGEELEQELENHCILLEEHFFGLQIDDLRRLAYEMAVVNGIEHNFSQTRQMAGKKWFYGFMKRHPRLSTRISEKNISF